MKKILYFVLITSALTLGYLFLMPDQTASEKTTTVNAESEINQDLTTETTNNQQPTDQETADNCSCKTECICQENDSDCECKQTKTICKCEQSDGNVTVVESIDNNNEDIEELNPDETSEEDETIVNE